MKSKTLLASLAAMVLGVASCQNGSFSGFSSNPAVKNDPPMTDAQRKEYRDKLSEILANRSVATFNQWVEQTNALPPDFNSLKKINDLPDPFAFYGSDRTVKTPQDWKDRRAEIIKLFEQYDIGTLPPRPKIDRIVEVDPATAAAEGARGRGLGGPGGARGRGPATTPAGEVAQGGPATAPAPRGRVGGRGGGGAAEGSVTKIVDLFFGPEGQIRQRVTLTIPPGNGPFPVLMGGQANITSRGYISCTAPSNVDNPPDIARFYPEYTWGSMAQCAWMTSMVVDYLHTVPQVDKRYIAITGYSRGGKYAAISAMLDERITACVAGSTGVGGLVPWRSAGERGAGEGIESTTRSFPLWFTKSIRFFTGREDRLPVDGNLLGAAIAPRALLSGYNLNDEVANSYANEQSYFSAQKVYALLGAPDRNSIVRGPGYHSNGLNQAAVMDWLDIQFGKSTKKWENDFLFPWDYSKWEAKHGKDVNVKSMPVRKGDEITGSATTVAQWETKAAEVRKAVDSMLGSAGGGNGSAVPPQQERSVIVDWVIGRASSFGWFEPQKGATEYKSITFGDGIRGELYYPKGTAADAKLPTIVWLHGHSYPLGYMWVYRTNPDLHPILAMVKAGYAVLAFDQTGHGSRMGEFAGFFDRNPNWSRFGKMIADTRAGIDAIQKDTICDPNKIYLYGYSMGGALALHVAAVEPRVKGVVSICGFTPMRTDTESKGTGGLARNSVVLPQIPKLGLFIGDEARLPYDYNELIAAIAPRPVYVISPTLDRDATPEDVHTAVDQARKVYTLYSASDKLALDEPWDFNRLPQQWQDKVVDWMAKNGMK